MKFIYSYRKMAELFANSGDPDQIPRYVASDLGLHYSPITLLRDCNGLKFAFCAVIS